MAATKRRSRQRTERRLQQAFVEVVGQKGFGATSILDITERADVSRGTFYVHYADKYALMDTVMRAQFQQQLADRLPPTPHRDRQSLEQLIRAVLEILEGKYRHHPHRPPLLAEVAPHLERVIQEELTAWLMMWLEGRGADEPRPALPVDVTALIMSSAICGAALQWSQEPPQISSEQMAQTISQVLTQGVGCPGQDSLHG